MTAIAEARADLGVAPLCRALGVSRATFYRRFRPPQEEPPAPEARSAPPEAPPPAEAPRRPAPPRTLSPAERQDVLDVLHDARFVDQAPREVYATLLDEGVYLCSVSTMYRLLTDHDEVRERRAQARHPSYAAPQLVATAPRQVWTWDITRLRGPDGWFYLYVVLDLYSRYAVGWMLAHQEQAELAERLLHETCLKEDIVPGQLTMHSDRGAPMTAGSVVALLASLGVGKSLSRPRVSNDNPYSEAQFKTLKYGPTFPDRFGSFTDAQTFCRSFFAWYNQQHHHSGLGLLTPAQVHHGQVQPVLQARQQVLDRAFATHPERFVHGRPTPQTPAAEVWINPPVRSLDLHDPQIH